MSWILPTATGRYVVVLATGEAGTPTRLTSLQAAKGIQVSFALAADADVIVLEAAP